MPKSKSADSGESFAFIKKLAANDRPTRDAALESLKQLLKTPKTLDSLDCQKLWRGLYFTMWHSDRPRTQQALAENMASLLDIIKKKNFFTFLDAFWKIIAREWDGIDRHRLDKFYLLLRRYVNHTFLRLKTEDWDPSWVEEYQKSMSKGPLSPDDQKIPNAIRFHMFDVYIDELEKVLAEELQSSDVETALESVPFDDLLLPVKKVAENYPLKTVRQAANKYVFEDGRLVEWGVVEKKEEEVEEEEDDDEWAGFD